MYRRDFLRICGAGLAARRLWAREVAADLAVIGGGVGGFAAALAGCRAGLRVILTEETQWLGGQLTQQGVPPDEHPWIEQFGATRSYREFRRRVRDYYRASYPLTAAVFREPEFNPGNCSVSRLCHEPRVAVAVLEQMLAPYVANRQLVVLLRHKPVGADVEGDFVRGVEVLDLEHNARRVIRAPYFVDATELGDLLPLTGTEYVTGAEAQSQTGELHAKPEPQPHNNQAITWCFAVDYVEGEDHTIERPAEYDFWRDYVPQLSPPWPGKLLSFTYSHPITLEPRTLAFDPSASTPEGDGGLWRYRRMINQANFEPGHFRGDICLVNWPQNDYWLGNVVDVGEPERLKQFERARQLSLSLLYWLQTEAPRPKGGYGWPGLRLRGDVLGTRDGLAMYPYIRESRRIRAEFTVTEAHVGTEQRMQITGKDRGSVTAETFRDSVGIGSYRIDLHPSTGGDNYIDISSLPFQIPLGALLPQRVENLLAGAKNIGTTHITNGCYRLHPVEWNAGEAAGWLVAFCLARGTRPRAVRNTEKLLGDYQRELRRRGVELEWPDPLRTPR